MSRRKIRSIRIRDLPKDEQEMLRRELRLGLAEIRCYSLYDTPAEKVQSRWKDKFGLCADCTHFALCASEFRVKAAFCKELRVGMTSDDPVRECTYYAKEDEGADTNDMIRIATLIEVEEDKKAGF